MNTFTPQSSYSYEEIIECGKGNLFGKGNAQLPAPPMLCLIASLMSIKMAGYMEKER